MHDNTMTSRAPKHLVDDLIAAILDTDRAETVWDIMAKYLVPLSPRVFVSGVSFISVMLRDEAVVPIDDDESAMAQWELDNEEETDIILSRYAVFISRGCPANIAYTLLGYCMHNDIPFFSFQLCGNLIPEYSLLSKAKEKADMIAAIFQRAEAEPDNIELHKQCLQECADLDGPAPPQGSALARTLVNMMEPDAEHKTRH